ELQGRALLPGFNESHSHLLSVGLGMEHISLYECRSIADIVEAVREAVRNKAPGEWVVGVGWAEAALTERRAPTRFDIDPVSPNNPVLLQRIYNADCVNTRALELAGITPDTPNPPGGLIERDETGAL